MKLQPLTISLYLKKVYIEMVKMYSNSLLKIGKQKQVYYKNLDEKY